MECLSNVFQDVVPDLCKWNTVKTAEPTQLGSAVQGILHKDHPIFLLTNLAVFISLICCMNVCKYVYAHVYMIYRIYIMFMFMCVCSWMCACIRLCVTSASMHAYMYLSVCLYVCNWQPPCILCHITLYYCRHIILVCFITYHIISYHITLYYVKSNHIIYRVTLYCIMFYYITCIFYKLWYTKS